VESAPADLNLIPRRRHDPRERRVTIIWCLLFFNALTPGTSVLPIPHRVAQLMTEGALILAVILVLTINPRLRIRPNWFLGLYTVLAISSLMMTVRSAGLGTDFRTFRLIAFLCVLWLLTPWWGRRNLLFVRSQMWFLSMVLISVILGLMIWPGKSLPQGRLSGTIWPIFATQVAHFSGELFGLVTLLWLCRLLSPRRALVVAVPALIALVLTHTRTALLAMIAGLLVASLSLVLARRRVRRFFAAGLIVLVVVALPAAPLLTQWLTRGEDTQALTTLTGRTVAWSAVLSSHRPATNVIFGSGLSNDAVNIASNPAQDGLSIDSSWISIYQDQGIFGDVLVAAVLVFLLLITLCRARGPTRALALFLIVYCIMAGISESGLGSVSPYLLDLAVAASIITFPAATGNELTFRPIGFGRSKFFA
jgi:hypothetical protein